MALISTTTTKLNHISHEHPLILIDDFDSSSIAAPLVCDLCLFPIVGVSPAYTCSQDFSLCSFLLHKRCAESPECITFSCSFIEEHELFLTRLPSYPRVRWLCSICLRISICMEQWVYDIKYNYRSTVCMRCAVIEPVLGHEGHQQHPLTLLRRNACFLCDACGIKEEEFDSYLCHICHQYWIHSSCAASPRTIKLRIHEDDSLQLIYSIPQLYRGFTRHCAICRHEIEQKYWAYFCEESGYFVHIKCATDLLASGKNVIEKDDDEGQTYPDLMQFPRACTGSLVADLIAEYQSGMLTDTNTIQDEVDNEKEGSVIHHWSHPEHPLILLEELKNADNSDDDNDDDHDDYDDNDDDDDDDDERNTHCIDDMLVCNGCIQPISGASNKHYYGCIGCNFFLHTSCANHLPLLSPPGKCTHHPEHTLTLSKKTGPSETTQCGACRYYSNGFMYECVTCKSSNIDICCSLAPDRIKHDYHKHPLVRQGLGKTSTPYCNACLKYTSDAFVYRCETCSDIQIHGTCAMLYPKIITHRWDSHSISLIYPPIYYKGILYCEICELEVNQEAWLYRCRRCDKCFHPLCIRAPHRVKLGLTIDPSTHNLHPHTLTLKVTNYERYAPRVEENLSCSYCKRARFFESIYNYYNVLHLECAGCNYRLCNLCAHKRLPYVHISLSLVLARKKCISTKYQ